MANESGFFVAACPCGARFRVRAASAGKKARCPKCSGVVPLVAAGLSKSAKRAAPKRAAPASELLDDLAFAEQSSNAVSLDPISKSDAPGQCPKCGATLSKNAKLCVSCGLNLATGRTVSMTMTGKSPTEDRPRWLGGLAGTLMLGVICSSFGALAGAVAWATIAVWTNYELGFVAWVLGLMAGAGMRIGFRDGSPQAAVLAACIALIGIIGGKGIAVGYVHQKELATAIKMITSEDQRIYRLANHRVERTTEELGICPADPEWERVEEEQYESVFRLTEDETVAAIEELDEWEAGGRWNDESYVRNRLVHEFVMAAVAKEWDLEDADDLAPDEIDLETWESSHKAAREHADSMGPQERIAELKRIESERERRHKIYRLASHRADRKADSQGLSPLSKQRNDILDQELARAGKLSDAKLNAAIEKLGAWEEGGRWENDKYVRDYLIYSELRPSPSAPEFYDAETSDDQFNQRYAEVAAKVDAFSAAERMENAKRVHDERRAQFETMIEQMRAEQVAAARAGLVGFAGIFVSAIVKSMLNPIDLLFVVLALGTAYKVSSGFADDNE